MMQNYDLQKESWNNYSRCGKNQGPPGSVRFGYGLEMERFKRFRFSVRAVPLQKGFFSISVQFNRKGRFRFRFQFLENRSGGSGSAFGFGKNGPDGSGFRFRFGSWATLKNYECHALFLEKALPRRFFGNRRGVKKYMGNKSSKEDWDADLSPCNFVTTHFPVLSPCNFATAHLTACILNF